MSREEFKLIFDKYFDTVRNYIYYRSGDAELATDIAQDTFLRVWEKQLEYIPGKIVGLLYKIASDLFISRYRHDSLQIKFRNSITIDYDENTPENDMAYRELQQKYETALANLSEKQRTVFLMSRNEGLKYHEIAERLDLSVKAVEKRMKIALDYLKENLLTHAG
ncbi:sigma-70 family RNA polymerase sigma factor [Saccharicrinis sp. FJH62]|uniref:sigma-70 family RNA polymerase sigma factor n=1 Tax=Saccharicrinis sp. FJH62 TaxID=3344657 RepID=UPI0035D454FF